MFVHKLCAESNERGILRDHARETLTLSFSLSFFCYPLVSAALWVALHAEVGHVKDSSTRAPPPIHPPFNLFVFFVFFCFCFSSPFFGFSASGFLVLILRTWQNYLRLVARIRIRSRLQRRRWCRPDWTAARVGIISDLRKTQTVALDAAFAQSSSALVIALTIVRRDARNVILHLHFPLVNICYVTYVRLQAYYTESCEKKSTQYS